jgi:hypothetical protein
MLFFPVFAKLQRRIVPPAHSGDRVAVSRLAFQALPVIQPLSFQTLTDSFAQWTHSNPFAFNRLRTLSIAMGGVPPYAGLKLRSASARSAHVRAITPFFAALPLLMGGGGVSRRNQPARQPSRKFDARAELHLRGARRTPPAPSLQRGAAPQGNTARREDGRWREVKWPERRLA